MIFTEKWSRQSDSMFEISHQRLGFSDCCHILLKSCNLVYPVDFQSEDIVYLLKLKIFRDTFDSSY